MTMHSLQRTVTAALLAGSIALAHQSASAAPVPVVIASLGAVSATPQDSESVQAFLKSYESTLASGRVQEIVKLYVEENHGREAQLNDYFTNVISDLVVRLDDVDITVKGDTATVSFKRTDSFVDRKSRNKVEKSVELDRSLQRDGAGWRIALGS